jgi:type III restriction enzyme
MFREIHDPIFHTQVLGRIRRTAEQKIYRSSILNTGYVYTNYRKNDITSQYIKEKNKAKINFAKRKQDIEPFTIFSEYIGRTDYNTLVSEENQWQDIFIETANNYFNTSRKNIKDNLKNFTKKNGVLNNEFTNQIITNAKVISTDNKVIGGVNVNFDLSQIDIEKTYDWLCYKVLKEQSESAGIYNAARSKSPLKKAINVYFRKILGLNISEQYKAIINELSNQDSHLCRVITDALKSFRPIHDKIVKEKERQSESEIDIPPCELGFTDDYKTMYVNKNAYDNFYTPKIDKSEGNEPNFINFIDNHPNVKW